MPGEIVGETYLMADKQRSSGWQGRWSGKEMEYRAMTNNRENLIYLDSAATSYHKPPAVAVAVADAVCRMGNAGRGAHPVSLDTSRMIYETRMLLAELFNAGDAGRVAFTANSTESLNMAIRGVLKAGDHVITTVMEHNSVLRPLYVMEDCGVEVTILPLDDRGRIQVCDFEAAIRKNTKAVVCTHASNLTGDMNDLAGIGAVCRSRDILFIVDASQTAGVFPIDMERMKIDILCFTGHKGLMGPQGTGGICVREGVEIRPLLVGGSGVHSYSREHPYQMPTRLEAGTLNSHGIAGMNASLKFLREHGIDRIRHRESLLMRRFYEGVRDLPGVILYGCFDVEERAPIVTLNIGDHDSADVADELSEEYGILTRAGAHCAPLMHQALGTGEQGTVRFSFSYFNTEEEVDRAVEAVKALSQSL